MVICEHKVTLDAAKGNFYGMKKTYIQMMENQKNTSQVLKKSCTIHQFSQLNLYFQWKSHHSKIPHSRLTEV